MSKHQFPERGGTGDGMKHRRRRYLIDKRLQLRLVIYNATYFLVTVAIIGLGLLLPLVLDLYNPNLSIVQQGEVADKILYLHARLGPVLLVILLALCVHSVFVSHKIAGPLYRFRATFKQVAQGDLSKGVKIRRGDFLLNEQAKIEEMIESLRSRLTNISNEQAEIEQVINRLVHEFSQSTSEHLKANISRLQECDSRLKKELEYFRLTDVDVLKVGEGHTIIKPDELGK
jgi:methyl-accepting chemotaxis protein